MIGIQALPPAHSSFLPLPKHPPHFSKAVAAARKQQTPNSIFHQHQASQFPGISTP